MRRAEKMTSRGGIFCVCVWIIMRRITAETVTTRIKYLDLVIKLRLPRAFVRRGNSKLRNPVRETMKTMATRNGKQISANRGDSRVSSSIHRTSVLKFCQQSEVDKLKTADAVNITRLINATNWMEKTRIESEKKVEIKTSIRRVDV